MGEQNVLNTAVFFWVWGFGGGVLGFVGVVLSLWFPAGTINWFVYGAISLFACAPIGMLYLKAAMLVQ